GPVDELDPVDRADISMINDDRAVTIEEDARPRAGIRCLEHQSAPAPWQRAHEASPGHADAGVPPLPGQAAVTGIASPRVVRSRRRPSASCAYERSAGGRDTTDTCRAGGVAWRLQRQVMRGQDAARREARHPHLSAPLWSPAVAGMREPLRQDH